jgi:hypothetical protein
MKKFASKISQSNQSKIHGMGEGAAKYFVESDEFK